MNSSHVLLRKFTLGGSSTLFIKINTARQMVRFDSELDRHQDIEFLTRLLKTGKLAYVDEELMIKYDTRTPSPGRMAYTRTSSRKPLNAQPTVLAIVLTGLLTARVPVSQSTIRLSSSTTSGPPHTTETKQVSPLLTAESNATTTCPTTPKARHTAGTCLTTTMSLRLVLYITIVRPTSSTCTQ